MSDFFTEFLSGIFGVCCIAISSSFTQWNTTSRAGSGGLCCNRHQAGCCGCCCNDSFNEDNFEEQMREDMEKTRDPNGPPPDQPRPGPSMIVPESTSEAQPQVEVESAVDRKEEVKPPPSG